MNKEAQQEKDLAVHRAFFNSYDEFTDEFDPYQLQLELIKRGYIIMKL